MQRKEINSVDAKSSMDIGMLNLEVYIKCNY